MTTRAPAVLKTIIGQQKKIGSAITMSPRSPTLLTFPTMCRVNNSSLFSVPKCENLLSQRGVTLQNILHFGNENWVEQLQKHPLERYERRREFIFCRSVSQRSARICILCFPISISSVFLWRWCGRCYEYIHTLGEEGRGLSLQSIKISITQWHTNSKVFAHVVMFLIPTICIQKKTPT